MALTTCHWLLEAPPLAAEAACVAIEAEPRVVSGQPGTRGEPALVAVSNEGRLLLGSGQWRAGHRLGTVGGAGAVAGSH